MSRSIISVIVSFIAVFVVTMILFSGVWFTAGPDRLFQPGTFTGSMFFNIALPTIVVISGLIGGWICRRIGRNTNSVMVLAGIILISGIMMCYFTLQRPEPTEPRGPDITMQEYMDKGREPMWLAIFNPIARAATVLVSGLMISAPRKTG